jgi:ribokinase
MIGRIGDDEFGRTALQDLAREDIDTDAIFVDDEAATGVALIMVDAEGENMISVAGGANAHLQPANVRGAREAIAGADMLLAQLEVPRPAVLAAARIAREAGVRVLLNPAPAPEPGALRDLLPLVDYLVPNTGEAARLLGEAFAHEEPRHLARKLAGKAGCAVVLTLGRDGACICEHDSCCCMPAPEVRAVDTVGAGDCFCATLAVALAEGRDLGDAAQFAICAAALAVQTGGAQPSLPHRPAINEFITEYQTEEI